VCGAGAFVPRVRKKFFGGFLFLLSRGVEEENENEKTHSFSLFFASFVPFFLSKNTNQRSYGLSQGSPTERGLRLDAAAALAHALGRADVDPTRVGVFGRSLGGAVALALAASRPEAVAAVVVENTFLSIEALAPKVMPFLAPVVGPGRAGNFLIRNKWRNQDAAAALVAARKEASRRGGRSPRVLLISSLDDEMLPPEHMALLHALLLGDGSDNNGNSSSGAGGSEGNNGNGGNNNCGSGAALRSPSPSPSSSPPVAWLPLPGARHMDAYDTHAADYWPPLVAFAADAGVAATGTTPAGSAVSG